MNLTRKDCWIVGVCYDEDDATWEPEAFALSSMQRVSKGLRATADLLPDLEYRQRGRDLWLTERSAKPMAPFIKVHYALIVGLGGFCDAWEIADGLARRMNRLIESADKKARAKGVENV